MLIQQKNVLLGIGLLLLLTTTSILVSCSSSPKEPFIHRGYLGWMIDMSRTKTPCNYGSTAIPNIEPIQAMPRDFYFVPTVHSTGQRLINLFVEGGRACETYARTRGNPGDKATVEVIEQLLSNPDKDIEAALAEVLAEMYKPKNDKALATLIEIYDKAEEAFFTNYPENSNNGQTHDIILLMPRNQKVPSSNYIECMAPDAREKYAQAMESILAKASTLEDQVGDRQNLELLSRCLTSAYKESK
jgi:hypothetical protein